MNWSGADLAGAGDDDRRVLHRAVLRELVDDARHGGLLLPDGDVEAVNALALLVDDRVDGDGGLARLAVADDELALARGRWGPCASMALMPVCSGSLTGWRARMPGALISTRRRCGVSIGPLPSMGCPSALTTRPTSASPTGTSRMRPVRLTTEPSLTPVDVAEERRADVVVLEVEHEAHQAAGELEQLAGHGALEAVDAGDAVADAEHGARLGREGGLLVVLDLLLDDREISSARSCIVVSSWVPLDLETGGAATYRPGIMASRSDCKRVRSDPSKIRSPTRVTTPAMSAGSSKRLTTTCLPVIRSSCACSRA